MKAVAPDCTAANHTITLTNSQRMVCWPDGEVPFCDTTLRNNDKLESSVSQLFAFLRVPYQECEPYELEQSDVDRSGVSHRHSTEYSRLSPSIG